MSDTQKKSGVLSCCAMCGPEMACAATERDRGMHCRPACAGTIPSVSLLPTRCPALGGGEPEGKESSSSADFEVSAYALLCDVRYQHRSNSLQYARAMRCPVPA
eukprot:3583153-Rhodomonas_salina.5